MQFKALLIFCQLILMSPVAFGQTSLMTYNIRYSTSNDGENWWEYRKDDVAKLITHYKPDILGIQEGLFDQVQFLKETLESYKYVGVGRDDGQQAGEYTAVFYNTSTYKLVNFYTYWLSETPDKVSVGWDAALPRITTYVVLKSVATGDTLHVFNCHYDHLGKLARENSSRLILSLIAEKQLAEKSLVVMGDLNSRPGEKPVNLISELLDDSYLTTRTRPQGPVGTFNNFDPGHELSNRIDYILTGNLMVESYRAIDDKRENGLYPSDHLPVLVRVNLP